MANQTILIIEDEEYLARSIRDLLKPSGYEIHIAPDREEGREKLNRTKPDLLLLDLALPPSYAVRDGIEFFKECLASKEVCKIVVMTGQGKVDDAIECIRFGADDFLLKPINPDVLAIVVERALYKHLLERKVSELEADATDSFGQEGIVGTSKVMKKVFKGILYAASIDENVLITGETGVGKGVVARAIQKRSDRRDSPFVHVNCAALSRTVIESELFGHEKGGFTGAKAFKFGKFEYAGDGTIFLNEGTEIPVDLQIKLLHAVEEKTIQEEHEWPGNVRELKNVLARAVISTTNKALSSDDLTISLRAPAGDEEGTQRVGGGEAADEDLPGSVEEQLTSEYRSALLEAKGNKSLAAKLLGIPESTFRYRLKKYRQFLRGV